MRTIQIVRSFTSETEQTPKIVLNSIEKKGRWAIVWFGVTTQLTIFWLPPSLEAIRGERSHDIFDSVAGYLVRAFIVGSPGIAHKALLLFLWWKGWKNQIMSMAFLWCKIFSKWNEWGLWDTEASQPTWSDLHDTAFTNSEGPQRALVSCAGQMFRAALLHFLLIKKLLKQFDLSWGQLAWKLGHILCCNVTSGLKWVPVHLHLITAIWPHELHLNMLHCKGFSLMTPSFKWLNVKRDEDKPIKRADPICKGNSWSWDKTWK